MEKKGLNVKPGDGSRRLDGKKGRMERVRWLAAAECMLAVVMLVIAAVPAMASVPVTDNNYLRTISSPHILGCGQSVDGSGTYVIYSKVPGKQHAFNPGLQYAIEYGGSVRRDPASGWELAEDLRVLVYDTSSGERLYTANVSGMLREVRQDYVLIPTGLGIRISQTGKEYLLPGKLMNTGTGRIVGEEIVMDLETGELLLHKDVSKARPEGGSGGKPEGKADEEVKNTLDASDYNREIRKNAWLSTLYTNILELNGYAGAEALARPACYVLGYSPEKASVEDQHLQEYFSMQNSQIWKSAPYITCSFGAEQGSLSLVRALFGDPENMRWDGAVIYSTASWDECEHPLRSIEDFYRWYRYDRYGRLKGQRKNVPEISKICQCVLS